MTTPYPDHPQLIGNFAPIRMECDIDDVIVRGELPPDLDITYYRNGPDRREMRPSTPSSATTSRPIGAISACSRKATSRASPYSCRGPGKRRRATATC